MIRISALNEDESENSSEEEEEPKITKEAEVYNFPQTTNYIEL